jgi:hypothetical protein
MERIGSSLQRDDPSGVDPGFAGDAPTGSSGLGSRRRCTAQERLGLIEGYRPRSSAAIRSGN